MPERENPEMLWLSLNPNKPVRGYFEITEIVNKIKPYVVNDGINHFIRSESGEQYLQCKEGLFCVYWGDEYARFERPLEDGELEILNSDIFQNRTRTSDNDDSTLLKEIYQMKYAIHAVTVLEVQKTDPLNISGSRSFEPTELGRQAAKEYFEERVLSFCEDFEYSEEEMDQRIESALEECYFEIGEGCITIFES